MKENSGVHNPSLHLAQLRWRGGGRGEREEASSELIPPQQEGTRGRRREGWRWHTMAVCVCGEEMAYNGSRGEGAGLLCAPPTLPPTYRERKGEGVKEDQDIALCVRVPCFRGDVKNGHIHGEGAVVGGWAAKRPPSWGEGRRWKTPAASARLNKNSYFRFILLSAGVPASQSSGTNPEKRGGGGGRGRPPPPPRAPLWRGSCLPPPTHTSSCSPLKKEEPC